VTWHRTAVDDRSGFGCFEVPVIATVWSPARSFVGGGMAQAVRETVARRHTHTAYTNVAAVTYPLDIADTGTITAFLVDATGRILLRTTGEPEKETTGSVLALVDRPAGCLSARDGSW
jgi:hypothetical protein